jgi:hypothetical protein
MIRRILALRNEERNFKKGDFYDNPDHCTARPPAG